MHIDQANMVSTVFVYKVVAGSMHTKAVLFSAVTWSLGGCIFQQIISFGCPLRTGNVVSLFGFMFASVGMGGFTRAYSHKCKGINEQITYHIFHLSFMSSPFFLGI